MTQGTIDPPSTDMSISSTIFVMPVLLYAKWNPSDNRFLQSMHDKSGLSCDSEDQETICTSSGLTERLIRDSGHESLPE